MTPYSLIYNKFLKLLESEPLYAMLDIDVAEDDLLGIMELAIFEFEYPKVDLKDKDDEAKHFNQELGFDEIQMLIYLMTVVWLRRKLHSADLMKVRMTPQEFKTFSTSNQLNSMLAALEHSEKHAKRLKAAYSRRENGRSALYKLGGD